jgi:TPR repeat protein
MTELSWMYEKGEATSRDYKAAAKWYLEAWDRGGDKWAAYRLSQFYENGLGAEKNQAIANFWYTLASSPAAMCG